MRDARLQPILKVLDSLCIMEQHDFFVAIYNATEVNLQPKPWFH